MNTLLLLFLLAGIVVTAAWKKVAAERKELEDLTRRMQAQIEEMNKHPLVISLKLSEEIALLQAEASKLPDLPETRSEHVILKEQLRIASFEIKLYEMVHKGCHPNPDAINTEWCLTSARLQLQFAKARFTAIKSVVNTHNSAADASAKSASASPPSTRVPK